MGALYTKVPADIGYRIELGGAQGSAVGDVGGIGPGEVG